MTFEKLKSQEKAVDSKKNTKNVAVDFLLKVAEFQLDDIKNKISKNGPIKITEMSKNMKKYEIKALQTWLRNLSLYKWINDGKVNNKLTEAINIFKKKNSLAINGELDLQFVSILLSSLKASYKSRFEVKKADEVKRLFVNTLGIENNAVRNQVKSKPTISHIGSDISIENREIWSTNEERVAIWLQNLVINWQKINLETAAAIYGNIAYETWWSFDPNQKQYGGWPWRWLCQRWWQRLIKLKSRSDARTVQWQINFIKRELENTEKNTWQRMQSAIWYSEKTKAFMTYYERPSKNPNVSKPNIRIASASNFIDNHIV